MNNISDETNLKKACVMKKGQRFFYPKTIPREREPMTHAYLVVIFAIIAGHLYLSNDKDSIISVYAFTLAFYFFILLCYRLIIFIHELRQSHSRYEDSYLSILKAAFSFNIGGLVVLPCLLYIVYYLSRHGWPSFEKEFWFNIAFLFFLHKMFDLDSNPINDSLTIGKGNGLDYGSGMAYSFFYGYLNYILPKHGDENKNLKELMQDYEATNNVKFEVYKIFMLIPKSLECPVSIADVSRLMEMRNSLLEKQLTVAGVRDRVYKNSVYTIEHPKTKKQVYVCTEYATPLKTFKEVVKNTTSHTEYYKRHKNDILLQFYLTLRQILEHERMDDMCELVYYEDMDANNKFHDIGRILLDRIVQIKKEQ